MKFGGTTLVVLAAIFWGITGGIADILMSKGWDPLVISFYRGAVGLLCFIGWFLLSWKENWIVSGRLYFFAIIAGLGVAGNFTFYFLAIESSSIAVAATLMYTAPVFVLLVSFVLGIENSSWFKWICIVGVLIGIVLLTGAYNTDKISAGFLGIATGLGAGVSYALFIFGFKKAAAIGKPQMILTTAFLAFCVILFLLTDTQELTDVLGSGDIGWFLLLGILGAGASFIIYLIGVKWTSPSTASMVAMVEPVTASLFGVLILSDTLTLIQLAGMILILFTITTLSMKQSA
ncbi:DMT family transporter [Salimicrobium halophilum]|uniref:Threonine/homoserine efflux transporter RhtA n=1 Tax=Salimicrobium halophilum TaxID=86666 RepID=A0A1G8RI98_9BACI|nr:EamA family transporter [Salimicrobium halophilum]SDJ16090.1 Threonine/homoserine efflux transporter RhtA [Salimicrobium halophilum]